MRFITFGLLRQAKGVENALAAFAQVKAFCPDFAYIVCGSDHPRNAGSRDYRRQLLSAVANCGLEDHVFFLDQFLEWPDLVGTIQACHVGLLPYTSPEQSSSGVLALTLSCGRPVVATDFHYAKATVSADNGIIVPIGNVDALVSAISGIALDADRRRRMSEASYTSTRSWIWREVAQRHLEILDEVLNLELSG